MKQLVAMVDPCKTVADIGCDHGYVAIMLVKQGLADKVIAMDIKQGPLSRAVANVREQEVTGQVECRLSDGLEQLKPGEADTLILAGMGGHLMIELLERGKKNRRNTETLILQPQSHIPEVRRYLHKDGYRICREEMLLEDGKYYTIIKGVPGREVYEGELPYRYGSDLLNRQSEVLYRYLKKEEQTYAEIASRLEGQTGKRAEARRKDLEREMRWNQEAQKEYEAKGDY